MDWLDLACMHQYHFQSCHFLSSVSFLKKTCELRVRKNNPEQMQAKDVKGCTEMRQDPWAAQGWAGPVEGTGAHTGKVKNFGTKGYGFITMEVWRCNDEMSSTY